MAVRALLLLALLAVPAAGAQALQPEALQPEACRPPVLALQQPPGAFDPGGSQSLLFAVENPNGPPVESVRATVTTIAPAGWTAIPAQREMTLGPQNVSITALAVTAPNRGSGAAAGNVTVHVTFVCTSGEIQTSASSTSVLEVSMEAFRAPGPLVVGAFLVLLAGVVLLGLRRLRRGVQLVTLGDEKTVAPGKSVKFTFVVENGRGKPQKLHLLGLGAPPGWVLHLALDVVELEPGEEKTLWAILKAPPHATPGEEAAVTLRLGSDRGARDATTATLRARVV